MIGQYLSEPLVYAIGWTILHTLWQGAAIALPLALLLAYTQRFTPRTRYLLSATGLLLIAVMATLTFISLYQSAPGTSFSRDIQISGGGAVATISPDPGTTLLPDDIATTIGISLDTTLPVIATVWLLGILLFTVKFLAELVYIRRMRSQHTVTVSPFWQSRFEELCSKIKVSRGVRLAESALVQVPVVIGVLKPVVLLPLGTLLGLPAAQVEAILAHELAHIRRHDYLVNILQTIAEILFFYHPAVWWLSSRMRVEREHCCDDIAVAVSGSSTALAKALAELQQRALMPRPVLAATGGKYHLLDRIRRIIEQPAKRSTPTEHAVAAGVLAVALLVVSISAYASFASTDTPVADSTAKPDSVDRQQPVMIPDAESTVEQPDADAPPDQPVTILSDSYNVQESTTSTATTFTMHRDNNGRRERIEARLDAKGKILELSVDGKNIPPAEFAKYQSQIDDVMQKQAEAMRQQEEAMQEQEKAMREQGKAMQEQEKAMREQEKAMQEHEKIMRDQEAKLRQQSAELEKQSRALEKQAAELEQQGKELEKRAIQLEKEMREQKKRNTDRKQKNTQEMERSMQEAEREARELDREVQALERDIREKQRQVKEKEREARAKKRDAKREDLAKKREKQGKRHYKMTTEMESELLKDKLISSKDKYEFKLTSKELYINGKKQPQATFEKYRNIYSSNMQTPMGEGFGYHIEKTEEPPEGLRR